jgi:hypothetical protein
MTIRMRKLAGTIALVAFLIVYALVAAAIAAGRITEAAQIFQVLYFLVAGLLWVVPAGLLIRWMQRPDPE